MAITLTYDSDIDCLTMLVIGSVRYGEILQLRDQIINHPDFRTDINQLFDCSLGELELTTRDLERIASDYSTVIDLLGHKRKLALVVSRDTDYRKMGQYEIFFYAGPGVALHSFRSLADAKSWLKQAG